MTDQEVGERLHVLAENCRACRHLNHSHRNGIPPRCSFPDAARIPFGMVVACTVSMDHATGWVTHAAYSLHRAASQAPCRFFQRASS